MKKFITLLLSIFITFIFTSCQKLPYNTSSHAVKTNDTYSEHSSVGKQSNSIVSSTDSKASTNSSKASNSSTNSGSEKSSISDSKSTNSTSESSSKTTSKKSTSSKKSNSSSKHTHKYYRPQNHWEYIGDGLWDGSGWRDEKTRGKVFPTCTEKGFTVYVCSSCGHVKYDDYVKATGHQFSNKIKYVYPGYKIKGYSYYSCENDNCEEIKKVETLPARKGNLSGIDKNIVFKRGNIYDTYTLKGDDYISISDCRTWGSMPTITVDYEEKHLIIEYDLEDGTIDKETIDFPSKLNPDDEHLYYNGIINPINKKSGRLYGSYRTRGEWDGKGS